MLETTEKTGKKKHDKKEREDWRTVGEILINPLSFTHLAQSHGVSRFPAARSLSDMQIFCSKSSCRLLDYKRTFFGVVVLVFLRLFRQPVCATLALFPRLSPWQPWQLGTPTKVLPLFYPLGRFERMKTVLMGTNTCTSHTCIPGLVWQKKHVDFHNLSSKSANSDFPFTLYVLARHYTTGGTRPPFFPLRWIRSIRQVYIPVSACLIWNSWYFWNEPDGLVQWERKTRGLFCGVWRTTHWHVKLWTPPWSSQDDPHQHSRSTLWNLAEALYHVRVISDQFARWIETLEKRLNLR